MGFVYLKKKQTAAALQVFKTLTQWFPKEAIFRYHLALALRQNGDVQAAGRELRAFQLLTLSSNVDLRLDTGTESPPAYLTALTLKFDH